MTRRSGNIDDFGLAAATLAGPLEARLAAIADAGITRVMLDAGDVAAHPRGLDGAAQAVRSSGLRVSGLQWLNDFEGLSGPSHAYKVELAKALLQMAAALGAPILLASSSANQAAAPDLATIARDLRKLAVLAVPLGLKVAYQGTGTARTVRDCLGAWDVVCRADMPNLGLAVDALEAVQQDLPLDDLELIEARSLYIVRLADGLDAGRPAAGQQRVLPGEGVHREALAALVLRLAGLGFRGDFCLEPTHPDNRQVPPAVAARRARAAAEWLGEEVLRRSVPLPGRLRLVPASRR